MAELRTVIEETEDICTFCGGLGHRPSLTVTTGTLPCVQCSGRGYIVTKRITRIEQLPALNALGTGEVVQIAGGVYEQPKERT